MDDTTKMQIIDQLLELIVDLAPDATMRDMYGGTVIELEAGNPKSRIGGIYGYAGYVSLELTEGAAFDDLVGVLEGSGKLRRHVKLRVLEDIETKQCRNFLRQAALMV